MSWTMLDIFRRYKGMTLLLKLNSDRILYLATIAAALWAGAFIGSFS